MSTAKVVLATTTAYQSEAEPRFGMACRTITAAAEHGYEMFIVDGSSDPVRNALAEHIARVRAKVTLEVRQEPGMGPARRQAIAGAWREKNAVVWLEPEKYPLVPLLIECHKALCQEDADLVIPRRFNLDSYPGHQMMSELIGNHVAGSLTGRGDLDLWFGPRVMFGPIVKLFLEYDGQYGDRWDSIFIPVIRALANDFPVVSQTVDYVHPSEQTAAEGADSPEMLFKRVDQRESLLEAIRTECELLGLYQATVSV